MRKTFLRFLTVFTLVSALGLASNAGATSYEDSLDDCSYPKVFDAIVLRPLGAITMFVGAAAFVSVGTVTALTSPSDVDTVLDGLVLAPGRFTFGRPLGECTGVVLSY